MVEVVHVYACPGCHGDDLDLIPAQGRARCRRCGLWFWVDCHS